MRTVPNEAYTDSEMLAMFQEARRRVQKHGTKYLMANKDGGTDEYDASNMPQIDEQIKQLESRIASKRKSK